MNFDVDLNQGEQSKSEPGTLHILSDLATPHNNALVDAVRSSGMLRVITWYAFRQINALPWKEGLGGEIDNYYFDRWKIRWRLLSTLLRNKQDHILLVGYANLMNQVVLLWCVMTGRRFMMWFDHPQEKQGLKQVLRVILYKLVKKSDPLFVVGEHTKRWFINKGFAPNGVVNLPIFIEIPSDAQLFAISKAKIREKYKVSPDCIFAVGASRLTYAKGYDLLIQAVALLEPALQEKLRVLIIGSGPERDALLSQVYQAGLQNCIHLEEWLSPEDYSDVVASADIFLHPARFDAFGGGTLFAMAYGVPVIGSEGAGTVVERIEHGINGLRYPAEATKQLAEHIRQLCFESGERESMGIAARETAKQWSPARGASILMEATLNPNFQ